MTNEQYYRSQYEERDTFMDETYKAFRANQCKRFLGNHCKDCPLNKGDLSLCFAAWLNMEHNAEDDVKKQVTVDDVKEWLDNKCEMLEDAIWSANLSDSTDGMKAKLEVLEEMRLEFGFKERKERK